MSHPRYVRIDAVVTAYQYDPNAPKPPEVSYVQAEPVVITPRGNLRVEAGDWIIISEHTIQVCPPEHFDLIFRPLCRSTNDKT